MVILTGKIRKIILDVRHDSPFRLLSWSATWKAVSQAKYWQFSLILVGCISSLIYPHVPLVAFSVVAGNTLTRQKALISVTAIWLANQLYGFIIRQYPPTWEAFIWGIVMGVGTLCVTGLVTLRPTFCNRLVGYCLWLIFSLIAGSILYQGAIVIIAWLMGGQGLISSILWRIFLKNTLWVLGLSLIHGFVLVAMVKSSSK
ncbi:MAG: hypothetical protein AB4058_21025 [Microcystaceae cyanobacterium]